MINLTIDDKQIEVTEGTTVLEAAEVAGIVIPTLCHHHNLTPFGGCRLCMVEIEGARILQPSCTLPATNGMIVHTNTEKVKEARKFVLSLIFSERNHFCMYCQATDGDCDLQNAAYEQDMDHWPITPNYSPFVVDGSQKYFILDNNRCILCRRCVRACADLVGNYTLGIEERGANNILVADYGVPLGESTCISCGVCVQICPTGALIDRNSAYQGRLTDLKHHISVCTDCSIGCQRNVLVRDNRLVRIDGVWEAPLNEGLLCEAGRYDPIHQDCQRLYTPLIKKDGKHKAATWDEALTLIASKFNESDQDSLIALSSLKLPIETLALFKKTFTEGAKVKSLGSLYGNEAAVASHMVAKNIGQSYESRLDVLKQTDVALIVGADLVKDHQVAGFFLKRQLLDEIKIIVADSGDNGLFSRSHLKLKQTAGTALDFVNGLELAWNTLTNENDLVAEKELADAAKKTGIDQEISKNAAKLLGEAGRPVIVLGGEFCTLDNLDAIEKLVSFANKIRASVVVIKDQANSLSAAQLGFDTAHIQDTADIAFLALGDESPTDDLVEKYRQVPFLAVYSAFPNQLTDKADVVLPATIWAEESGTYLSTDGRLQTKDVAINHEEGILNSFDMISKLAEIMTIDTNCDWKSMIQIQPASIEFTIE